MLEGFELYNMTTGVASISISENGVGFSKAAVMKMNKCEYTKVFIDRENKRLQYKLLNKILTDQCSFSISRNPVLYVGTIKNY